MEERSSLDMAVKIITLIMEKEYAKEYFAWNPNKWTVNGLEEKMRY